MATALTPRFALFHCERAVVGLQVEVREALADTRPDQVQQSGAAIWFSLRPVGDHEIVPADDANLEALVAQPAQ